MLLIASCLVPSQLSLSQPDGAPQTLRQYDNGLLKAVSFAGIELTSITHDLRGRVATLTTPDSRVLKRFYEGTGAIAMEQYGDKNHTDFRTTRNEYDQSGFLKVRRLGDSDTSPALSIFKRRKPLVGSELA